MINLSLEIDGKKVSPNGFRGALEQLVLKRVTESIKGRLRDIRPTASGEFLSVTLKGHSLDKLSVELSGPEELIAEAKKRLKN